MLGIYGLYFFQGRRKNALIVNNWFLVLICAKQQVKAV